MNLYSQRIKASTFANCTSRTANQSLQKSLLFTNPKEKEILKNAPPHNKRQ
jgi:hypothetical protein